LGSSTDDLTSKNSVKLTKMFLILYFSHFFLLLKFVRKRVSLRSIRVHYGVPDIVQDVKFLDNMILKFVHEIFTKYKVHDTFL